MGLCPLSSSDNQSPTTLQIPCQPNPYRFTIINHNRYGSFSLIKVRYPDATSFEGIKILVYKTSILNRLVRKGFLDPHFAESGDCPIARFAPTKIGWKYGVRFCLTLVSTGEK